MPSLGGVHKKLNRSSKTQLNPCLLEAQTRFGGRTGGGVEESDFLSLRHEVRSEQPKAAREKRQTWRLAVKVTLEKIN